MKQPKQTQPAPHEWRNLYHAADELRRLNAGAVLSVESPVVIEGPERQGYVVLTQQPTLNDEILLACCMSVPDHLALQGAYDQASRKAEEDQAATLLGSMVGLGMVTLMFFERRDVSAEEMTHFRRLRLRYPGEGKVWPAFLSLNSHSRIGLSREEVLRMTHAFEVLASFLPDMHEEPESFFSDDPDELLLLHTVEEDDGEVLWQEGWATLGDLLVEFPDADVMVDQVENPDHPGWKTIVEGTTRGLVKYIVARELFTPEQIEPPRIENPQWITVMFESMEDEGIFALFGEERQTGREIIRTFFEGLEIIRKLPSGLIFLDRDLMEELSPVAERLGIGVELSDDSVLREKMREAMIGEVRSKLVGRAIQSLPAYYYGDDPYTTFEMLEEEIPEEALGPYRQMLPMFERVLRAFPDDEYLRTCHKLLAGLAAEKGTELRAYEQQQLVAAILYIVASRNELWSDTYGPEHPAELYGSTLEEIESLAGDVSSALDLDHRVALWMHSSYIDRFPFETWNRRVGESLIDIRNLPDMAQDHLYTVDAIPSPPHHSLAVALEERLPMTMYVVPDFVDTFNRNVGTDLTAETPLTVEKIGIALAVMGVAAGIRIREDRSSLSTVALAALRPEPGHELEAAIEAYREGKRETAEQIHSAFL